MADIVRRLDGMPLAIELAAGRLSTFSLADLHHRLDRSLDLLGGGRLGGCARHRTLRATIEWFDQLLFEDERRLFRHLSVFADGIDLAGPVGRHPRPGQGRTSSGSPRTLAWTKNPAACSPVLSTPP